MLSAKKFVGFYSVLLFLVVAAIITYRFTASSVPGPAPTPTVIARPTSKLYPTRAPAPTLPVKKTAPGPGISPGIFYPYHDGVTINNPTPTIIGQIPQTPNNLYLPVNFGLEDVPYNSGDQAYYLRFTPGKAQNLTLSLDGRAISPIYAIPRYPTVICRDQASGDPTYDSRTACLQAKASDLPPVIFFAKISSPLSAGKHTLSVVGKQDYDSVTFTVDPDYRLPPQSVFTLSNSTQYPFSLISADTCAPGYYYSKDYLKFPLPAYSNQNLIYRLALPRSAAIVSDNSANQVSIAFAAAEYELFFPPGSVFYEGKSQTGSTPEIYLNPFHQLFLPLNMLVYPDGRKAKLFTETKAGSFYDQTDHLDIVTTDITGGVYPNSVIRFTTTASSGCDG